MFITLVAFGSRGDVQPHIALGAGLQRAGHDVRVVTHALFEPLIRQLGLDFAPLSVDPRGIVEGEQGQDWLGSGSNALQFFQRFSRIAGPLIAQTMRECWLACQGADMLVFSPLGIGVVSSVAEKLGIPYWIGAGQPLTPTRECAIPFFPQSPGWLPFPLSSPYNRATFLWSGHLFWQLLRSPINKARDEVLNLPPLPVSWLYRHMKEQSISMLYYFSPSILPRPRDWNERNAITGYWHLDDTRQDWQPPADLLAFLACDPPPLYIGFGSMRPRRPAQMTGIVMEALAQSGQRAILASGWGGINATDLPEHIYALDYAPHDWLFPQLAAVVHHGGAGTMAATVRAGVPAVIIPFFGDQPFWGKRYASLGVIPQPIPQQHLSAQKLARAIRAATGDGVMRERMRALSERVREERGVERAIRYLE